MMVYVLQVGNSCFSDFNALLLWIENSTNVVTLVACLVTAFLEDDELGEDEDGGW